MIKVINETDFPAGLKTKATIKLIDDVNTVIFGQQLDSIYGYKDFSKLTEGDVLKVFEMKTSAYTIQGPMHLGAILAGATENDLAALDSFAVPLGKAFQLTDDVIGTFGSEEKTGKSADSDLKEGKRTILVLYSLKNGSEQQKKIMLKVLNNAHASKEECDAARKVLTDTGAVDYSKKMAEKFKNEALDAMMKTTYNNDAKQFLIELAEYIVAREK
ncbi:polyprenyl synthetase family protein, partial [archaeon]|nr:polyprenyl synthetase family protein [archaeon]